jgi:hypothetical protein
MNKAKCRYREPQMTRGKRLGGRAAAWTVIFAPAGCFSCGEGLTRVSAFSAALGKEPEKAALLKALHFFKVYGKVTWIAGYIAVLIGVIAMLVNLEDKTAIGPNLALALTAMLYSGIIQVVLILPFRAFIHKRLLLAGMNSQI